MCAAEHRVLLMLNSLSVPCKIPHTESQRAWVFHWRIAMMLFSERLKKKQHVILPTSSQCQLRRPLPILVLTNVLLLREKEHKCINCTMYSCFKSCNWPLCTTGFPAECLQLERYQCYKEHSSQ